MTGSLSFGWGERFYHSLCPVTLTEEDLKACPHCDMVRYSSEAAREEHQPIHEPLCKLISKLRKATGGRSLISEGSALQVAGIAKVCLKRNLTQAESDILMYPRVCSQCFLPVAEGFTCPSCSTTVHCSSTCMESDLTHPEECRALDSNRKDYIYWHDRDIHTEVDAALQSLPSPLPTCPDMSSTLTKLGPSLSLGTPLGRALSSSLSCPLSTLLAIPAPSANPLIIHLVGARRIEVSSITAWAFLPYPALNLVMIGPECPEPVPLPLLPPGAPKLDLTFIPPCTYAEYSVSPDFMEPDLVCAFNCGFILYSSWAESLPHMLRYNGAPLLFTEYYLQDCEANLAMVEEELEGCIKVVRPPSLNPYSSGTVNRSPPMWGGLRKKMGRSSVICDNHHIAIVKRKQKGESTSPTNSPVSQ